LKDRWSPNTIAGRWNLESPDVKISAETIYQWIYSQKPFYEDGILIDLRKFLVRARTKRGLRRKRPQSNIKERISVHERPEHINQRIESGHYEADLIFNKGSQSKNICTLIERITRQTILLKNEDKRSETVIDAIIEHIQRTGISIKSITFDNGSEFTDHTKLNAMGIKTYFCDPGSPWQKGGIENFNGLVRRHLPFAMDAFTITIQQVEEVARKMNSMPRKILGFKTPLEASACINHHS
jgi:IS30 family transposase